MAAPIHAAAPDGGRAGGRADGPGGVTLGLILKLVACVFAGALVGLAFTAASLDPDRRGVALGPWRTSPRDGGLAIDPYALAANARTGALPLGSAEGLSFLADSDDGGRALDPRCDYTVSGPMPPARYWTLSLFDLAGFPLGNAANRYGFTSAEILRFGENAPGRITVSPQARPGNWLPAEGTRPYRLMLRLYDTSLSTGRGTLDKVRMPSITRDGCP